MIESKLQSEIIKWLKNKGCFVMKCDGSGVPAGTSDILFCFEGFYGFIEVKAAKSSPFRPLQKEFLQLMSKWSWAKVVYPGNWDEIKSELEGML